MKKNLKKNINVPKINSKVFYKNEAYRLLKCNFGGKCTIKPLFPSKGPIINNVDISLLSKNKKHTSIFTSEEKKIIRVANFVGSFDGMIPDEHDRKALLEFIIEKFIPVAKRDHLRITEIAYPVKIKEIKKLR